ncbi:hypothetical protein F443_18313, partial [Phytophthora nicotianae P1569]
MRSSRDRIATLERSEKALEDATAQLRRQAEAGNRRLARLREECGEYQERLESLRDERDQANTQLRGMRERLTKTRSELQSQAEHITSMRSSMSRLEGQVAQWRGANAESQATLTERTAEIELLRQDQDRLSRVYNELQNHYAEAYTRFSAVASAMGQTVTLPPPSNFVQAEPRERHCPTPTPPPPSSIRDRPVGLPPSTRAPKSARTPFSSSAPRDTTSAEQALPAPSPQSSTSANNDVVVEHNAHDSDLFGSEDDEEDPNYLAALARSRAELRRSHSHEEHRTDLVQRLPAAPNPDDDGSSSSTANSSSDHSGRGSQLSSSPDVSSDDTSEIPLTFSPNFMISEFVEKYLILEDRHMQALWESLHFLPISTIMCRRDPKLAAYHEGRRQRRSRAGEAWTRYLRV